MAHQRIVFLDECTANVDMNTDSEVQKAERNGNAMVLAVEIGEIGRSNNDKTILSVWALGCSDEAAS